MSIRKYGGRYWALYDDADELVCVRVSQRCCRGPQAAAAASLSPSATHANPPHHTPRTHSQG
jgi:hypothetical protein